jgi:hypothetical protein
MMCHIYAEGVRHYLLYIILRWGPEQSFAEKIFYKKNTMVQNLISINVYSLSLDFQ